MVRGPPEAQPQGRDGRPGHLACSFADGPDRDRARPRSALGGRRREARDGVWCRQLLPGRPHVFRSRCAGRGHRRRSGRAHAGVIPRGGTTVGQAVSHPVAGDRKDAGGTHQGRPGLARQPECARVDGARRGPEGSCVLLVRQAARRGRVADRRQWPRRVPDVGWHRFAGRRLAHDAPRVSRAIDSFSRLSVPVHRLAGQGAGPGPAPDALSAPEPPVPGPVWRGAASDRGDGVGPDPRGDLPPTDAPDCRAARVVGRRQRPGDGRRGGAGGVPDAGEPRGDWVRRDDAGVSPAGRHGQGRDRRRCRQDRDLRHLNPARRGLLPAVHTRQPVDAGHHWGSRCGRGIITARRSHRTGGRGHHRRGLPVADGRINGSALPQSRRREDAKARRTTFNVIYLG